MKFVSQRNIQQDRVVGHDIIAREMASRLNMPLSQARKVCRMYVDIVKRCLMNGNDVLLTNFGKFHLHVRKGYIYSHSKTKQRIEIPHMWMIKFRVSTQLKKIINSTNPKAY